ncbi:hypothetical protein P4O66_010626, partial [Electrophorus voltai]
PGAVVEAHSAVPYAVIGGVLALLVFTVICVLIVTIWCSVRQKGLNIVHVCPPMTALGGGSPSHRGSALTGLDEGTLWGQTVWTRAYETAEEPQVVLVLDLDGRSYLTHEASGLDEHGEVQEAFLNGNDTSQGKKEYLL